ncbi:MAG: DUF2079 domain-containing protein, partial [Verrucomicrobia bacterium]|nr:DUF2079 domain-containing protein [Verrucomicrobiota bacterium]
MYLLFPALEAANLAEFHAVTFAPAPLLFAYHYAREENWKRFALCALIALAVKEEIALLVFVLGVWAAISHKSQVTSHKSQVAGHKSQVTGRKLQVASHKLQVGRFLRPETWNLRRLHAVPIFIAILSLAWFFIAVFVIVPHFAPAGRSVYVGRYTCASEALRDPLTAIPQLIGCVLVPEKIAYVLQLFASAGFIAIFDPLSLLLGAPSLVLNLLSSYAAQYSGTYHYSAPVAPYFVLAAIGGTARILNSKFKILNSKTRAFTIAIAFFVAFGYHWIAGYTPIGGEFFWKPATPHQQLLARFIAQIPRDAIVTTTGTLFPHLSHRRVLYRFPLVADAEYVLLDVSQASITN